MLPAAQGIKSFLIVAIGVLPFVSGCAVDTLAESSLSAICLADNADDCQNAIYAGTETELVVFGDNLHPAFAINLDQQDSPSLSGSFAVTIGETALQELHLDVSGPMPVLRGTLPGTTAVGMHAAILQTPSGNQAELDNAFRIVNPLEFKLSLSEAILPTGHTVQLAVHLENIGSARIEQIVASAAQAGDGHLRISDPTKVLSLRAAETASIEFDLVAEQAGSVSISVSLSGRVNQTVAVGSSVPVVTNVGVLTAAALTATASLTAPSAATGTSFELIVDLSNTGQTNITDARLLSPQWSGSGSVLFADPGPSALDLPPLSSRRLRWSGQAVSAGTVEIVVQIGGNEDISGRELTPFTANSVFLEIL